MSLMWVATRGTVDLRPTHGRWRFWIAEGRDDLPEVRSSSQVIPFRRGRLHKPGIADLRPLEVRGYIKDVTDAAMRADLDVIKGLLDPEALAMGTLVDDFENGSVRWMRAIPRDVIPRYGGKATRLFSIALDALDPYWYGSWGTLSLDSGLYLDSGLSLDSGAEVVITAPATTFDLDTLGTADVERIRVRFVGPSAGPVGLDTVGATPVGFTVARTLDAGEVLEVDNYARTILLGGVSLRNVTTLLEDNRHGEYIRLPAGPVTLRASGGAAETRILFNPTYQ